METKDTTKAFPVVLPISHWEELRQESKDTGRSASAIVRDLVAAHLRRNRTRAIRAAKEGAA